MQRRLFTLASAASLLLCVATIAVWYVGYPIYRDDGLGRLGYVGVGEGRIKYSHWAGRTRPAVWWHRCGITYGVFPVQESTFDAPPVGMMLVVSAPLGMVIAATLILPIVWIGCTIRKLRTTEVNQCPHCSYNLTGNTSGTCPECGSPIPKPKNKESPRPA